ncbi:MAG: SIR2 family NAD-dependent protein deacylase [Actinomycetota bacterium]
MAELDRAVEVLSGVDQILVFTGAGVSTESGIPDFRGPNGLWTRVDPDDFTIQRYVRNPELRRQGWRMHAAGELWGARSEVKPNPAHLAIVDLYEAGRLAGCVTQNVDGLHLVAGLPESRVAELHGNVRRVVCLGCDATWPTEEILRRVDAGEEDPACPHCGGILKTSTVMFGELLPESEMQKAWAFAGLAGAVLVVGSTVGVWPAADIPVTMAREGKPMVIVNRGATEADHLATVRIEGSAGEILPPLVSSLLAASD